MKKLILVSKIMKQLSFQLRHNLDKVAHSIIFFSFLSTIISKRHSFQKSLQSLKECKRRNIKKLC